MKVMSIFGTRPEAIKMAPVVKAIEAQADMTSIVVVTAQHREMLDQVLQVFDIQPDYDLNIMQQGQSLSDIGIRALKGIEQVIETVQPDMVLVHGDTSTTFFGALAAYYHQVPVGHVEAGLRTFNKYEPFPEEMNRKLTGCIADLHFAPTEKAKEHLLAEGVDQAIIYVTGNTVIDALKNTLHDSYQFHEEVLNHLDFKQHKVIVMTAHRRENLGAPLEAICKSVRKLVEAYEDVEVVYAVHPNPKVKSVAEAILGGMDRVHLLEPLELEDMHNLLNQSYMVMTDSGGLQEEVPSMGKPVLVLRNVTERPEGVDAGTLKLVGTDEDVILRTAKVLIEDRDAYEAMAQAVNPYGDGMASERIVAAIKAYLLKISTNGHNMV